ncbi:LPXTG cell wall anchor domain-containing protein, partial [Enterococcus faecium]
LLKEETSNGSKSNSQGTNNDNQKNTTSISSEKALLPKTNERKSVAEIVLGFICVLLAGLSFFWKKRTARK